jgi:hypothetical protein
VESTILLNRRSGLPAGLERHGGWIPAGAEKHPQKNGA